MCSTTLNFGEQTVYLNILHATDLNQYHFELCQRAVEIAKCFKAKLYLLHVIHPPSSLQLAQGLGFAEFDAPVKDNAQSVLNVVGESLKIPSSHLLVETGSIKHNILEKAKLLDCKMIIIGSHTPSHLPPFLGSIAHSVIQHAHCDVLTLRTENLK